MFKIVTGDLIKQATDFDVLLHGCNCFCTMGSGIAAQIRRVYPEAYEVDCETIKGDRFKLGTITYTKNTNPTIVNCYTQYGFNPKTKPLDYSALRSCMKEVALKFKGKKIGMPLIGCGLAGGDWNAVEKIVKEELVNESVTVIVYEPDPRKWNQTPLTTYGIAMLGLDTMSFKDGNNTFLIQNTGATIQEPLGRYTLSLKTGDSMNFICELSSIEELSSMYEIIKKSRILSKPRKVYMVKWDEIEPGWGSRPDGVSIHDTIEIALKYKVDETNRQKQYTEYSVPSDNILEVYLTHFELLDSVASQGTIRIWQSDLKKYGLTG